MSEIYHEKQSLMLCGIHSLNNALQDKKFDKSKFDEICIQLDPNKLWNNYRNFLGLGNYDVNVLMRALSDIGYSLVWLNATRVIDEQYLIPDFIEAYLINKPHPFKLLKISLPIWGKHWVSYRFIAEKTNPGYYNLDSKLNFPEFVSSDTKGFFQYLDKFRLEKETFIFAIMRTDIETTNRWCR